MSACTTVNPPLSVPLDSVVAVVFLVAAFRSSVGVAAFSTSTCATPDPSPLELLDSVHVAVFLVTSFGSDGGEATFLALACAALDAPPLEPCTCLVAALLWACCPYDVGSVMELLSP
jgi:hypothetical protein